MSNTLRYGTAIVVVIFAIVIFNLVRRNKLSMKYALVWLGTAFAMLVAVLIPNFLDFMANLFGFELVSNMLFLIGMLVLMCISLSLTMIVSKQSNMIRLLTQEVSMLKSKEKGKAIMIKYVLTIVYLICTTGGITFMKLGGDSLKLGLKDGFSLSMGWKTFIGFLLYLISFLLWQRLIVKYDLSIMVPIVTGIVQILVLLIGHFVFKESLSMLSTFGAILIITGIILMSFGSH